MLIQDIRTSFSQTDKKTRYYTYYIVCLVKYISLESINICTTLRLPKLSFTPLFFFFYPLPDRNEALLWVHIICIQYAWQLFCLVLCYCFFQASKRMRRKFIKMFSGFLWFPAYNGSLLIALILFIRETHTGVNRCSSWNMTLPHQ